MLEPSAGDILDRDGVLSITTRSGVAGYAVFGDYALFAPGHYAVEFVLTRGPGPADPAARCARLEVVSEGGAVVHARRDLRVEEVGEAPSGHVLVFRIRTDTRLEFRVEVTGAVPITILDERIVVPLRSAAEDPRPLIAATRFPDPEAADAPAFLRTHPGALRRLHRLGVGVSVVEGEVVLRRDGVSFLARIPNDLTFVEEVLFEGTYRTRLFDDACVIDIGMNTGLASLQFASDPRVREVHAFEPFAETHARALANIALNPELAAKISVYRVGLSDQDQNGVRTVPDVTCSGAATIREVSGGKPVELDVRDAATTLAPIIAAATAAGRRVVMKVDCEGSEFAIFRSLAAAGLLGAISAVMVEWHRVFDGRTQDELVAPLLDCGFIVFDRSPPATNGFFYAVRVAGGTDAALVPARSPSRTGRWWRRLRLA